ncbi:hypothetical protein [Proteiniclasticum ruminis]|uniref:hypothetical protein n=1 Tax=Proteiniclasticum ruminis TaxID=398199 RepID=UPI0028AA3211|nr:hypothetical protein [Proteiniclasticum ruminis]
MKKVDIFTIAESISKDGKQYLQHDRHLTNICSLFINIELWNELTYPESVAFQNHIVPVIMQNKELKGKFQMLLKTTESLGPLLISTGIDPISVKDQNETDNLSLTSVLFFTMLLEEYENIDLQEVLHSKDREMIEYIDLGESATRTLNIVREHYFDDKKSELKKKYLSEKDRVMKLKNANIRSRKLKEVKLNHINQMLRLKKSVFEETSSSTYLLSILHKLEVIITRNLNKKYSLLMEKLALTMGKLNALPMNLKSNIYRQHGTYLNKFIESVEKISTSVVESNQIDEESKHAKFLYNLEQDSFLPKDFTMKIPKKKPSQE